MLPVGIALCYSPIVSLLLMLLFEIFCLSPDRILITLMFNNTVEVFWNICALHAPCIWIMVLYVSKDCTHGETHLNCGFYFLNRSKQNIVCVLLHLQTHLPPK